MDPDNDCSSAQKDGQNHNMCGAWQEQGIWRVAPRTAVLQEEVRTRGPAKLEHVRHLPSMATILDTLKAAEAYGKDNGVEQWTRTASQTRESAAMGW